MFNASFIRFLNKNSIQPTFCPFKQYSICNKLTGDGWMDVYEHLFFNRHVWNRNKELITFSVVSFPMLLQTYPALFKTLQDIVRDIISSGLSVFDKEITNRLTHTSLAL